MNDNNSGIIVSNYIFIGLTLFKSNDSCWIKTSKLVTKLAVLWLQLLTMNVWVLLWWWLPGSLMIIWWLYQHWRDDCEYHSCNDIWWLYLPFTRCHSVTTLLVLKMFSTLFHCWLIIICVENNVICEEGDNVMTENNQDNINPK